MSIQHNNPGSGQSDSTMRAAFAAADVGTEGNPGRRVTASALTAAGINTHFRRAFGRTQSGQTVIELEKAFKAIADENVRQEADSPLKYSINTIDSADNQDVNIACVLVTCVLETDKGRKGVVFTILAEGSIPQLPFTEYTPSGSNKPVPVQMTAGDYATETLWAAIETKLKQIHGSDIEFMPAGSFTLPRTVDPTKEAEKPTLRSTLFQAFAAVDTFLDNHFFSDVEPLTIQVVTNNAQTSIVMDLNDAPMIGATGLPVRSDITMTLRSSVRNANKGVPDRLVNLVRLSCYVHLAYTLPEPPSMANQRPDTRRFTPVVMLTNVESETNLVTNETTLLALAMAPLLDYNDQYLAPFMPSATVNNPYRDFGAIGYEVNLSGDEHGQPVGKEDLSKMSTAEIFQMAKLSLFPDLHVSLLVDESGPQTWLHSAFLAAATGSARAYDAIIRSANNLTGGVFDNYFQRGTPIATLGNTRVHMGYYRTQNDEIRDLLDIDPLWMLNVCGAKNIDLVYDYSNTLLGTDDPTVQLANRWSIITRLVPTATLVSYGQPVDLNPDFLTALTTAVKNAGLPLRAINSLVDFNNARGRASYQRAGGLNSQAVGSILSQGSPVRQQYGYQSMGLNSGLYRG